ncbi:MAG: HAD-IIB family hydrolase [Clostridia bacterium]|nr:HAD-IIB family hydrolase [Clostridia bacterium]
MSNRLYVTDLDGTLLNDKGELSDFSVRGLNFLISKGIKITVASARSLKSIKRLLRGVKLELPILGFNGGYISDFKKNLHLKVNAINPEVAMKIFHTFEKGVLISAHHNGVERLFFTEPLSEGAKAYLIDREKHLNEASTIITSLDEILEWDIMAYTYIDHESIIIDFEEKISSFANISMHSWEDMYYKPWYWMSIHSELANKGTGIKALQDMVDNIHELVVFGDNINDLDMFNHADQAFAVENAMFDLKKKATGIIGHHSEDSVIKKIFEMEGINYDTL